MILCLAKRRYLKDFLLYSGCPAIAFALKISLLFGFKVLFAFRFHSILNC